MQTSQFSSGAEGCPDGIAEGFREMVGSAHTSQMHPGDFNAPRCRPGTAVLQLSIDSEPLV